MLSCAVVMYLLKLHEIDLQVPDLCKSRATSCQGLIPRPFADMARMHPRNELKTWQSVLLVMKQKLDHCKFTC